MKSSFEFTLKGKDWWKPFLGFWGLYLVFYIPVLLTSKPGYQEDTLSSVFSLVFFLAFLVIYPIFAIIFLRIFVPRLSIGGKTFAFRGSIGRFMGIYIGGLLLSIITLTIYLPWYIRRMTAYLVSETTFDDFVPDFLGRGGRLLVYMLLAFWIPVAVLVGLMALVGRNATSMEPLMALVMLFFYIAIIPFCYLMYKWFVNFRWKDFTVEWDTDFLPSCLFILGQFLLIVITLSIYWPAAYLKIYRYFTGKTVISLDGREIGRLVFEGDVRKGFGLLWGQTLLMVITLGIYIPWAYSKIGAWIASNTCFENGVAEEV